MMQRGNNDFVFMTEYVKNILYFATVRPGKEIKSTPETHYFSIDNELVYENYYADFGPLKLGCVYKYCKLLNEKLKLFLNKQAIVHYASADPRKAANAAYLMGCYGVLHLGLCPKDALKPLTKNGSITYRPFQDATEGDSIFTITLLDCLKAIKKARDIGFFNFKDFNFEEYDRLDKIAGGDLNWIVPGKFLAFIGPVDYCVSLYHPPEIYIDYFLENNVKVVIRLNKRLYDGDVFNRVGIAHYDLFFADGSCPPRHVLFKFHQISEDSNCAIAVHCKAGLGRTGSLIGSYLIKHYRMTAREAIGWMRICRPGSVIGIQQGWLEQLESWLTRQGNLFRKKYFNDVDRLPVHAYGVYSIAEKSVKRKPNSKLFEKAHQSPPPPIHQWNTRSEIMPVPRPRASKFREVVNKTQKEQERARKSAGSSKDSMQRTYNKGDQNDRGRSSARRGSCVGSGERPTNPPSCIGSRTAPPGKTNTSLRGTCPHTQVTNVRALRPIQQSPSPVGKAPVDNKFSITIPPKRALWSEDALVSAVRAVQFKENTQMRSKDTKNTGNRKSRLNQALTVTPHNAYKVPPIASDRTTAMFSTAASRGSIQMNPRRWLGRSPSRSPSPPPAPGRVLEHTRATNTPNVSNSASRKTFRDSSKDSLQKTISRLKVVTGSRNGSIGGHSFGAASLGAQRVAPMPSMQRSPRVRSDERTIATQGDMLNSIKFQRRLRDKQLEKLPHNSTAWERPGPSKVLNPSGSNAKRKKSGANAYNAYQ